jgi:hypothetical protein
MKFYVIDYIAKSKGESGESCKSTYDLNGTCEHCGTPLKLIAPLITKGLSKINCDFFATLDGDFLISEELYRFLSGKGVRVHELRKVVDSRKREIPYYHLYTELNFPKSLPTSEGLVTERQCPVCKRNGYFCDAKIGNAAMGIPTIITPLKLKYKGISQNFLASSDLFHTWEHLGISNLKAEGIKVIRYARPMLIVSEKIKTAFEEYGVKDAKFEEVIIN